MATITHNLFVFLSDLFVQVSFFLYIQKANTEHFSFSMTNLQEMSFCYYIIKSVRGFVHRSCFLSDMHESALTANHNHQSLNHATINQVNSLVSHVRIWFAENKKHCNVNFHQQCFIVVVLLILHAVVLKLVVSVCIKMQYNNNMVMCRYLLLQ